MLDAVRWPGEVETAFLAAGGSSLPPVTADTYRRPVGFDPPDKLRELARLAADTRDHLGTDHPAARLLLKTIREAELTTRLIAARGTPQFTPLSRELYGSTVAAAWLPDLAALLEPLLAALPADQPQPMLTAHEAAADLAKRFAAYFGAAGIKVVVCDALSSDAAAGNGYLKLRSGATFTPTDVRLLEVHEGWAHLGTTLNGRLQPLLPTLAKCSPSATRTQEGLAVFLELVTGVAGRGRIRKLLNRAKAVAMAEAGADFRDVYRFFLTATDSPAESYRQAARVFRGGLPGEGGPFTKDLSYCEGLVRVLRFVADELSRGGWGKVSLLMCGKVAVEDVPLLAELGRSGWLAPPRWVPPPLRDRAGLVAKLRTLTARPVAASR
ncbi:MAG TPA: flavohemoglobin expression-modulating QEGLA motif protein [Gemmataceae bacterium]|nr:flavohemoglobin expression-modulating QEGLA motif protein [Gemmataceae bacterium]